MTILQADAPLRKGCNAHLSHSTLDSSTPRPFPANWFKSIPGEENTTPRHVYEESKRLVAAGFSIIPIEAYEGTKAPDNTRLPLAHDYTSGRPTRSWSTYQTFRPRADVLDRWFTLSTDYGLAVVGGTVSGGKPGYGLEIIDLDNDSLVIPWTEEVERHVPGLLDRLVRIRTPRPGLHVYYRCEVFGGCEKLACAPGESEGSTSRGLKTLIEVKGEGGYCLVPPSPRRCHPSCRLYQYAPGSPDLTNIPFIFANEREALRDAARKLNQVEQKVVPLRTAKPRQLQATGRPGDDFNLRADWMDILPKHGWVPVAHFGDETRWRRPGKDGGGASASTNHGGNGLLKVFSSNADPFDMDGCYDKFAAYTILEHDGSFHKAASALRQQGYGSKEE